MTAYTVTYLPNNIYIITVCQVLDLDTQCVSRVRLGIPHAYFLHGRVRIEDIEFIVAAPSDHSAGIIAIPASVADSKDSFGRT